MRSSALPFVVAALLAAGVLTAAEPEAPPKSPVTPEHAFLKRFVGDWESTAKAVAPGQPEMICHGKYTGRMLGGLWVVSTMKSEMMGQTVEAVQQIGYDPAKKKYVGTWIDSMLNHLWQYEGTVTADGKTLHLEAEGPNFLEPGKTAKFRDSYTFVDADTLRITSSALGPDGQWVAFMHAEAKRKK